MREELFREPPPNRAEVARRICARLNWHDLKGRTRRSREWNGLIERDHYLGYAPVPCAQARYFVKYGNGQDLALISFGTSAWKVAAHDHFIGWNDEQRRIGLAQLLNNARFLILPWVRSTNLTSPHPMDENIKKELMDIDLGDKLRDQRILNLATRMGLLCTQPLAYRRGFRRAVGVVWL